MPREIQINDWCDPCADQDLHTPATATPPITLGGMKPRTLLLCERHQKEILEPLHDLLNKWGDTGAVPAQKERVRREDGGTGIFPCLVPGCEKGPQSPYTYKSSLRAHLRGSHDLTYTQMHEKYGNGTEPQPTTELDKNPHLTIADFTCGIDGCTTAYDPAEYNRPSQALGVHKATKHGVKSPGKKQRVNA
jgi:hypothetical protein